ncbi:MAG: diaminopimelate decarboxylase [candidate division Zixibacteria bacterium]|nr:diaminopimelate decarboxylase [candidate division Zixibacteria bacterium]
MTSIRDNRLYIGVFSADELLERFGSPLYVYDAATIRERFRVLRDVLIFPDTDLHYACKANTNVAILRLLREEGACIDAVSPGEVYLALYAGFAPDRILFTGNNVTDEEMAYLLAQRILINIDSLSQLERYGRMAPGTDISLRINPDTGSGHHDHCITGGPDSKFGLCLDQLDEIRALSDRSKLQVVGLHAHVGSGILDAEPFMKAVDALLGVVPYFAHLTFVDFGGGFGVPYAPDERPLDIRDFGDRLSSRFRDFCAAYGRLLRLKLEPGRYLVAEAGTLLTRCNTVKTNRLKTFVGVDSGLHHLIRYPLYNAYHEIVNASCVSGELLVYDVCGQICESSDFFTRNRSISCIREGDTLAILNAGAYGFAMSSNYNSRPRPAEVLIDGDKAQLVRRRETFEDLLRSQITD